LQAIGRSRGGYTTKIHVVVDALGNPVKLALTPGQEADSPWAIPLLTDLEFLTLLADKGYDTDEIIEFLTLRGACVCIPPKSNRTVQREYDQHLYKERNLVERFFNRIKQFRRLATRYEKNAQNFLSVLTLVTTVIWLA
jgi:transposase